MKRLFLPLLISCSFPFSSLFSLSSFIFSYLVSAALGLLRVVTILVDLVMLYLLPQRRYYDRLKVCLYYFSGYFCSTHKKYCIYRLYMLPTHAFSINLNILLMSLVYGSPFFSLSLYTHICYCRMKILIMPYFVL